MDAKTLTQQVLNFWIEKNCFKRSVSSRSDKMTYRFYDGPPFASGQPHYGHLLSSSIKDLVPRYFTMMGYKVDRVWGWDCHGLPVENQIEKKLGLESKKDIEEKVGIDKFTDECRAFVMNVNDERSRFVNHLGRWIDFDNAYFTMNTDFMESVMNVFGTLYKNNYIFKGFKVGGYCPRCATTLSNHEINEGYQPKQDQALTVKFQFETIKNPKYETCDDGTIEIVAGVIKDSEGRKCFINHSFENLWLIPGGKVDAGEDMVHALTREIKEELGVQVISNSFVGATKIIHQGKSYKVNFYDIDISGTPQHMEKDKAQDLKWIQKIDSNNSLGFALKIDSIIIDDENQIKHDFVDFYLYEMFKSDWMSDNQDMLNANMNFLAWTTTPWTLPSNMFLAVGKEIDYVIIFDKSEKQYFILAKDLLNKYYKDNSTYFEIYTLKGKELLNMSYRPLYDFYRNADIPQDYKDKAFKVLAGDFVSTLDGTGIVHIAPAFGADDYEVVCQYENFQKDTVAKWLFMPIDEYGKFTSQAPKYTGMRVFDVNKQVITDLKEEKKVVKIETISHSYPHCRRCDTPLIYRAIDSWFVDEISNKEKITSEAKDLHFVPEGIKNRFDNILASAPDWNVSRKRYRGTPLPIWESENNPNERLVLSNLDELYNYTKTGSKNITKVLLLRHGESENNVSRLHDSYGKALLTDKGLYQANQIKDSLKQKLGDDLTKKDFVLYISPLQRCVQSINPFVKEVFGFDLFESSEYKEIKAKYEDFLENLNPLDLEERQKHIYPINENIVFDFSIAETYMEQFQDKEFDISKACFDDAPLCDGGESLKKLFERSDKFIKRVCQQNNGKTVIVISHGGLLTMMIKSLYDFNYDTRKKTFYVSNAVIKTYYYDTNISTGLDLHRPHVDKFWFYINGNKYTRIPDVLDCWFESGSMPYGEIHYPFDDSKQFSYPADFIAEGLDQTRGWFRALHVIGSLFMGKKAFKNVVVNGLILAEDGKKMSKKLKNYPDPKILLDQYGADSFRIYTLSNPVVKAEPMRFSEKGVEQTLKDFVIPLENVYNFFETYAKIDGFKSSGNDVYFITKDSKFDEEFIKVLIRTNPDMIFGDNVKDITKQLESYMNKEIKIFSETSFDDVINSNSGQNILIISDSSFASKIFTKNYGKSFDISDNVIYKLPIYEITNELDKWILSEVYNTLSQVDYYMSGYYLDGATRAMTDFIDKLTNWYLRRSRRRFWETGMNTDKTSAYNTLFEIFNIYLKIAAPFAPFISESLWLKLSEFASGQRYTDSIHLQYWPIFEDQYIDKALMQEIEQVREIIKLALYVRAKNKIKVKQPLSDMEIRI